MRQAGIRRYRQINLGRLKHLIDALIAEQGEDTPIAVFLLTAKDVTETSQYLAASGKIKNDSRLDQLDPIDVLNELQDNASPTFDEQLLEQLEQLLIDWDAKG